MSAAAAPPADVDRRLADFLDERGLGSGPVELTPIGAGHSNITLLLRRGDARLVLRRPPLGPLARSANDVVREASVLRVLATTPVAVPTVVDVCADEAVIGAPFYLMEEVDGLVLTEDLPRAYASRGNSIAAAALEQLIEIHAVPTGDAAIAALGRGDGYLERQVHRFGLLLESNAARPLPELERIGSWLRENLPASPATTVVHGDFRLGNLLFDPRPTRIAAVLDWEMATLGDPLADLGYFTAMWSEPDDEPNPMLSLSTLTREPGFPSRVELARRYGERTGADLAGLGWYQVLAAWKSAIFLEGSYKRFRAGLSDDRFFAGLEEGVPALARWAARLVENAEEPVGGARSAP
ncbi:MAG: phosphotransferase family protein [Actinobacteria bacterium]|nr:phosphotransferase family protein [Actinomycetota bacterium]